MKRQPGGGIIIFGSGSIVSTLTQHGLVDEYQLVVSPVVLGAGRKLIDGADRRSVELADARSACPRLAGIALHGIERSR